MQVQVTRSVAASNAATRPEFAEILERVRKLRPDIEARALAAEKAKRVPAETMEALRDADVFRLMQPQRFGGYEYGPAELAQIGFELGRACGSTGWCGTLAVCFGWMTAFFPLEAQQEVWDNPDNLLAVSYTPSPHVEQVDGGYKISGSWPWASGVDSAAWLILSALLPTQGGPPTLAWCLVPVGAVTIDHDSWNVSGLQGTGSKTVKISDPLFVPKHRVLPISAIFSGKVPGLDVPGMIRRASAIRRSARPRWSRPLSAWRRGRSTRSPRRRAARAGWRGQAFSRKSPSWHSFRVSSGRPRRASMRRKPLC